MYTHDVQLQQMTFLEKVSWNMFASWKKLQLNFTLVFSFTNVLNQSRQCIITENSMLNVLEKTFFKCT